MKTDSNTGTHIFKKSLYSYVYPVHLVGRLDKSCITSVYLDVSECYKLAAVVLDVARLSLVRASSHLAQQLALITVFSRMWNVRFQKLRQGISKEVLQRKNNGKPCLLSTCCFPRLLSTCLESPLQGPA